MAVLQYNACRYSAFTVVFRIFIGHAFVFRNSVSINSVIIHQPL